MSLDLVFSSLSSSPHFLFLLSLSLSLSLSPCVVVVVVVSCVYVFVVVVCACGCGVVWHAENPRFSIRPRVYRHDARNW